MKLLSICNKTIEYSFYAILFLVPLVFSGDTSELFELNKMWLTWGLTILIGTAWITKMILHKKVLLQRTPLDIILMVFLLSQFLSTMFSLDQHISWWGYYSRFNGGFLSLFTYVFLFYAFISNFSLREHHATKINLVPFLSGLGLLGGAFLLTLGMTGQDAESAAFRSGLMFMTLLISFFLFVKSFEGSVILKSIFLILTSALLVALWGLPAHYGNDPTCLVFRGVFDTNCWTDAFKPTIRAFSTLGQPAWLAAFMAATIPLAIAFFLNTTARLPIAIGWIVVTALLYLNLLFADTRAGVMGFWVANMLFWTLVGFKKLTVSKKTLVLAVFAVIAIAIIYLLYKGHYILFWLICVAGYSAFLSSLYSKAFAKYIAIFMVMFWLLTAFGYPRLAGLQSVIPLPSTPSPAQTQNQPAPAASTGSGERASETGITDSGKIRLYVWEGAVDAWKANPIIGTGVETFAFAYYKHKPAGHNLTSEWDYLYNKAHNEYLNYLATTGILGFGSYLAILGFVTYLVGKFLLSRSSGHTSSHSETKAAHHAQNTLDENSQVVAYLFIIALFSGWISILITNFFGFSVVIMNIFLFLFPAFILMLTGKVHPVEAPEKPYHVSSYQWTAFTVLVVISAFFLFQLANYRSADISYALGSNLNKVGSFKEAYPLLTGAVGAVPNEPVYKDELSINLVTLAAALQGQKEASKAAEETRNNAVMLSNQVTTEHPNNVTFWKNRVRIFYTLAQADPANQAIYMSEAAKAITKAAELAPNDAKILYNLGVLYGQTGNREQGIEVLKKTVALKPDYRDAYFALGLFYHEAAVDENNQVINRDAHMNAIAAYEEILKRTPNDKEVKDTVDKWKNQ